MEDKFYIVNGQVLQEVIKKVVEVKELLHKGEVKDITEGVKRVGISRSAFYKYRDMVFSVSEGVQSQKATIAVLIAHEAGALSKVLDTIAEKNGNILTLSQDMPLNNSANVTITLDISALSIDVKELLDVVAELNSVLKVKLIAME